MGEGLIDEAIKNNSNRNKIRGLIELQYWTEIKNFSKYWYSLRRDLTTISNGCILYAGKLLIPTQLRKTIFDSIRKTHPGKSEMISLAQLILYPQIYRDILALAQKCKQCTKIDKNLKIIIAKNKNVELLTISEPNEEVQMDIAGAIEKNNRDTYILVTIERHSRYQHAEAYTNCDTETVLTCV